MEIKFRVWIHSDCGGGIPTECYNTMDYSSNYQDDLAEFFSLYNPVFFEVMQYIGRKDKNGVELYVGDIVDLHQTINGVSKFIIEYSEDRVGYTLRYAENMVKARTYEYDVADVFTVEELEVVGNIFENSELIN